MSPFLLAIATTLSTPVVEPTADSPWLVAEVRQSSLDSSQSHGDILQLLTEGRAQLESGDYVDAIATFELALSQINQSTHQIDVGITIDALYDLGGAYLATEDYTNALRVLETGLLLIADDPDVNRGVAGDLTNVENAEDIAYFSTSLGVAHHRLGQLGSALNYYQQALADGSPLTEDARAILLGNIGIVEAEIGDYEQAQLTLQQAIALSQRLGDGRGEADATLSLGWAYEQQGSFGQAVAFYEGAIALYQQIEMVSVEAQSINNLGIVHLKQGNLAAAKRALDSGWALIQSEESQNGADLYTRSLLLDSFGQLAQAEGKQDLAWFRYLQGLQLSTQNNPIGEIISWLNLAALMEESENPNLAIFFYKRAIARIETIRSDLQSLSNAVQQKYTATVEDFYRQLADLLLQQNRTAEALQILELLKLQEVKAYFHSEQTLKHGPAHGPVRGPATILTPTEASLDAVLENLLESSSTTTLPDFLEMAETAAVISEGETATRFFDLEMIESLQRSLAAQPVETAALYPLVLDNRIELILITSSGPPIHRTVDVSKAQLTQTVSKLQSQLSADSLDPTPIAQQLYGWLVEPLDQHLAAKNIENIIYLPDSILRYVPLAALHDGQHWLVQKYQSHNITAASVNDLTQPRSSDLSVVAGALTEDSQTHHVNIGREAFPFDGLPGAKQEVNRLAAIMPDTMALFDRSFTPKTILDEASNHRIVHLATHAKFLPGQPEESFVLFGDGSVVTMRELGEWQLPEVDLVVFSACQTATNTDAEGKEILGLGFQMQQTGADSTIASLWAVDDIATAALMNQFYSALKEGKSKAEALQQAQTKLIESSSFSHPYQWAAFILIGNGL